MNLLRTIVGKTRRNRVRNAEIRQSEKYRTKFTMKRRRKWLNHICQTGEDRSRERLKPDREKIRYEDNRKVDRELGNNIK